MSKKVVRLTENMLIDIISKSIRSVLSEDKEYRNIQKAKRAIRQYRNITNQEDVNEYISILKTDIPNSRSFDCYYMEGLARLLFGENLDSDELDSLNDFIQAIITFPRLRKRFNSNLNDISYQQLQCFFEPFIQEMIKLENDGLKSVEPLLHHYKVIPITSFEEARPYFQYTNWCICKDEFSFNTYRRLGQTFYFCLRDDYDKFPKKPEHIMAHNEDYDLSMIAVSVYRNGRLHSSTTRENNADAKALTVQEITTLIGTPFYDTFKPL